MPHCPLALYNNLIAANWNADALCNVVWIGNSLSNYALWYDCATFYSIRGRSSPNGMKFRLLLRNSDWSNDA
jgi:hypothetical protein